MEPHIVNSNRQNRDTLETSHLINRGNSIFRQEMRSLTPKCDIRPIVFCNISLMIIFLLLGIFIVVNNKDNVEIKIEYTSW